jgi:acyl-CoA hydrolase
MDVASLYASKLTTPETAVADIPSGSKLSMAMAMSEPPALLGALASHEVVQQNHTSKPDLVAVARRRSLTACGLEVTKKTSWTAVPVLASAFSPVPVKYLISSLIRRLEPLVGLIRPGIIE